MPEGGRLAAPAGPVDLLVIAGEHSGDEHAARLVEQARARRPGSRVAAVGGPRLAAAGAQLLHDLTERSVVGLVEVLRHYGYFRALFAEVLRWVGEHRPAEVLLVDYPGFNRRLAGALGRAGLSRKGGGPVRVSWYIGPQIWAWKAHRRFDLARWLDRMAVIFPFEPADYADTDLPVEFVGHPFVEPGAQDNLRYDPAGPVLLAPGSRLQPVRRILPLLLAGARAAGLPAVALVPDSGPVAAFVEREVSARGLGASVAVRPQSTGGDFRAALTSSGTMSLRVALAGLPGAVVYRAHPLTYAIGRRVVRVPFLGIANLLLQRPAWPEFLQQAPPEALAALLRRPAAAAAAQAAAELRAALRAPTARDAAAWLLG